ncbi:MAG: AMP-binding protein [Promethearchaeota archaeon]
MVEKKGKGRFFVKKSGSGYDNYWIYLPSKLVKDSSFPFKHKDRLNIELKEGKLVITKKNYLVELIESYGIENFTLPKLIEKKATENKNKIFIKYNNRNLSYMDVNQKANQIADGIIKWAPKLLLNKSSNVKKTSKIGLMFPNNPEFFCCWFGIIKSGYIFVPINHFLRGSDLEYILKHSDCDILIIDYQYFTQISEIEELPVRLKKIFVRNAPKSFNFNGIYEDYSKLPTTNNSNLNIEVKFLDPMEIIYTEGTTGKPKGIIYLNVMVLAGLIISEEIKKYGKGSVVYCPTPLFQAFAQLVIVFSALFYNATIAIAERFNAKSYWDDVKKYKADLIVYYGGIIQALIDQPPNDLDRTHGAKWAVGGEAPKELWEIFENRFGITLYEGWAPSEAVGFTLNVLGTKGGKVGSIGKPTEGFDIKIVNQDEKEFPPIGEIAVKMLLPFGGLPSSITLFQYYKKPENTPMIMGKDGYVFTGDMGYEDKDGYLYYVGRKVDVIKKGGKEIYAHTIENIANAHPSVLESSVFGVPGEDESNEDIKICIVLKQNRTLTHKEFHYYLTENLVYYIVPRYIEIKERLRSSSERIKKFKLREEWTSGYARERTWDSKIKEFLK